MTLTAPEDIAGLEARVKEMYRAVAESPEGNYHFEMGRRLAERLGYPTPVLDLIPNGAVESFAGVGYFFDLAGLTEGEEVLDLGSGSGMDVFFAAIRVGDTGRVAGVDITPEQLAKAGRLAAETGFSHVSFRESHIEDLPFPDSSFDCVISNGVINLSPRKEAVFAEAARVLRPGGRLVIADIVSETQLSAGIVANSDLWASCIGGAAQQEAYRRAVEGAGLRVELVEENPYRFLSERARNACARYGVKSISLLAQKGRSTGDGLRRQASDD